MLKLSIPLYALLLSIVIHALWGGNAVGAKLGMTAFPPLTSALIRFLFGIATITLWCSLRGYRLWPEKEEWRPLLSISVLFTVQIGLMNMGFDRTTGVNGSILISTNPLFAAAFAHFMIAGDRLTGRRLAGLLLGFAGVVVTILAGSVDGAASVFGRSGDWICLFSASLLGFRLIFSASAMRKLNPFRLALWQMLFSLPLYVIGISLFETIQWQQFNWLALAGLAYQGIVIAGLGFMVSLWLISRYQPSIMVSFNFIAPVTGVFLSAWLLGETLTIHALLGVVLLAIGMVMVCTTTAKKLVS